ncbi:hypothetical protein [Undibacterium sp. TS12]|uniref:hypothetical protein n=1 Tax=Undibacterium sp. TS12 TaxID=2908202 RepID=UPI001F4C7466|nr:hypothetical protein [Undibacterium sp. TS12]MCH8617884.1 hypothetical protein [Undibacterium sp. TS12]
MSRFTRRGLDNYFYLGMAILIALIVAYGFGRNIEHRLLHPELIPPAILYLHAVVFTAWPLLFIIQSGLVSSANINWHRRLGVSAAVIGASLPVIGIATAIVMHNWHSERATGSPAFFSVSLNDMLTFAVAFGLAIYWRRKPEYHRRLMLIASASLTVAAFARFPRSLVPSLWWYAYVDALVLLGILRDLLVIRQFHLVYRYGLPLLMISQAVAMYLFLTKPVWWVNFLHLFLR